MASSRLMRSMLLAAALLGAGSDARAGDIAWYTDLKKATAAADKAGLPMFIDFWAEWCAACKAMDEQVYTNPGVIAAFKTRIVGVRLHFDLHRDLARTYNVGPLPHLVFANSLAMPLVFHRGYLDAADLTSVVNAMPPLAAINALDRRLRQNRNSLPDLLGMARALRAAGFFEASTPYYERASKHSGARADAALRQAILYETALSFLELREGVRALALLDQSIRQVPGSKPTPDFLLALARAHVMNGRHDQARTALETLLRHYPQSTAAGRALAVPSLRTLLAEGRRP